MQVEAKIYGRVQGVGFRRFVKREADKMGIKGHVSNEKDYVSIVAQGQKKDILVFLTNIQEGSFFSDVEGVSYMLKIAEAPYNDFSIVRDSNLFRDQKRSFSNLGKKLFGKLIVPSHVAIIPDGNRRWARERSMMPWQGHYSGASYERLVSLFKEAKRLGVKYFSIWAFSTENWNRDKREIDELFKVFREGLDKLKKELVENEARFRMIGRRDRLPKDILSKCEELESLTKDFHKLNLQICLDYGGRDEILRAVNKIVNSGAKNIGEETFKDYLDTNDLNDPDLVIRTSGEKRTSGFMPFQSTYAELYFSDKYFPDFAPEDLREAIWDFSRRKRNFGK